MPSTALGNRLLRRLEPDRVGAAATTLRVGFDDKVYSVSLLAAIIESLGRGGIDPRLALEGVPLSARALRSDETRISLHQFIQVCRNAAKLSPDPRLVYRTGQRIHLSAYGMFGFAILSSTGFRQATHFAIRYQQLAMPVLEISFHEDRGRAVWTLRPLAHLSTDPHLFGFLVELHLSILTSLHRDVMGPSFVPSEIDLTIGPPRDSKLYEPMFGRPVLFEKTENRLIYETKWLDREAQLGNAIAHHETVNLCDHLMEQLHLRAGLAGRVRQLLLESGLAATNCTRVAKQLYMTERTLRRKLHAEHTSFRRILDELRMQLAAKYLRETNLTIQEIAHPLGFSQDASFRHAFRRWTKTAPLEFREHLKSSTNRRESTPP